MTALLQRPEQRKASADMAPDSGALLLERLRVRGWEAVARSVSGRWEHEGRCPTCDGELALIDRGHDWLAVCRGRCDISAVLLHAGLAFDEPGAAAERRPLRERLLTRNELANLPAPQPLIADTIDLRTVALLAGGFATGKSFIALDWAACVASGRNWMGRPVQQGRALYVAAEGAHGLHSRISAWEYGWRNTVPDDMFTVLPEPVNLLDTAAVTELCALVAGHTLVVVDTLARSIVGGDENSAKDMGIAVDSLYRLRAATGDGTVVAVHHTGKDKTTIRGSSALESGVDTVYSTEGDARLIKLDRKKRKDGPREDTLQLSLSQVADSCVVVSSLGVDMRPTAVELMSTFMSSFDATGATRVDLRNVANMPPASFARALSALLKSGALVNTGTDTRPFYKAGTTG